MDLKELLELAGKDREAACKLFAQRYGADQVSYYDKFHYSDPNLGYKINPNNQHISIENFELMKKFLYSFGHLMKELRIVCEECSSFAWIDMVKFICTYCTTLKKLHLFNSIDCEDPIELVMRKVRRIALISRNPLLITKPCPTVEHLIIENIYLDSPLKLNDLFPKLRSLDLLTVAASDPSFIEVYIPKLEHLGLTLAKTIDLSLSDDENDRLDNDLDEEDVESGSKDVNKRNKDGDDKDEMVDIQFSSNNIKNAFTLNPQLNSIHLEMDTDISFIAFIKEALPNLQTIQLSFGEDDFKNHSVTNDIVIKSVINASLGHLGLNTPPIFFEHLKELDFTTSAYQSTIDYIQRHNHITSLHLVCEYSDGQAFKMVKELPNLKNLYVIIENNVKWSARGLMRFLAECERLNTLMLMLNVETSDQPKWRSLVANAWEIDEGYCKDLYTIEKTDSN